MILRKTVLDAVKPLNKVRRDLKEVVANMIADNALIDKEVKKLNTQRITNKSERDRAEKILANLDKLLEV